MEKLIKIGITQGDINGVGYEVILKTFADERVFDMCIPILFGLQKVANYYKKQIETEELKSADFHVIHDIYKAVPGKLNIVPCIEDSTQVEPGKSTQTGGMAAYKSLERAVNELKKGTIDGLLTAPINKHNIQSENFHFPGHTEYLENQFATDTQSLMILLNENIRVALVTGHIPLAEVKSQVTTARIVEKLKIFRKSLQEDFGIVRPRIAVLALNPHAGDDGFIGNEEKTVIQPALNEVENAGISVFGPYAADGFFGSPNLDLFDGILAMYHDQGLAPFKALAMDNGVNFTAGLSVIRTSPAHGTAYDIAGKNQASENSFRHALFTLLDIYQNRKRHKSATANPLKKQYFDRSGDKEKLDLTQE
ncbi:MAG: 4-hydroxythreonine-4-phosphate dehydrogenase PdxA [Tannerella sp.]|jgi:4-hydroxythreonine-4-phosphate dehydrogenase|nr:4-hydroxythreonine-4-phosphate dehydrogenase PdxA [Tannerella sp.]